MIVRPKWDYCMKELFLNFIILKYQNCFPMCSLMIANVESTVNGNAIKKSLIKIAQLYCDFVAHF